MSDIDFNYEFRQLEKEDYNRGFLELLEQLTTVNPKSISELGFCMKVHELKATHGHLVMVIINKDIDKIIASGTIFIEKKFIHSMGMVGHIEDVVVEKKYRNKGLGKKLIEWLVNFAKSIDCYKVILDCSEDNIGFYENCGFEKKGAVMSKYF